MEGKERGSLDDYSQEGGQTPKMVKNNCNYYKKELEVII